MSQKFVVATSKLSAEEQDKITRFLQTSGWQVWHWLPDLWLLSDVGEAHSAQTINTGLESVIGTRSRLIFSVDDPSQFFGRSQQDSWDWMRKHWGNVSK